MDAASAHAWNEESKTGSMSAITHLLQNWGQWFSVQYCHRGWELDASLRTGTDMPVTWITSPHFSQKEQTQLSAGKCMIAVFWDYRGISHLEYMAKSTTINSKTCVNTLKRLKEWIDRVSREKKLMFLQHDNVRPHTSAATSAAIHSIRFEVVPHPPYSPDLAPSWRLVVCSSQETFQRNSFNMWWRSWSCYGKMVSRTAWRIPHGQVRKTCSVLAALYRTRGTLREKLRYRSTVHILSCILFCFILITCPDVKIQIWRHYFLNTLHTSQKEILPVGFQQKITLHYTILPQSMSVCYVTKIRRHTAVLKFQFKMPGVTIPWDMPFLAAAAASDTYMTGFQDNVIFKAHFSDSSCTAPLPEGGWDKQIVSHWLLLGSLYTVKFALMEGTPQLWTPSAVETEWKVCSHNLKPCIFRICTSFFYVEMLTWDTIYKSFGNIFSITHTLQKYCKWTLFVQQNTFLTYCPPAVYDS
jgi:histone-lysine N-methyltransferase SETMAR